MTTTEMMPVIGQIVVLRCESMEVHCKVTDVKHVWGKARLLVTPMAGTGEQWVELGRVIRLFGVAPSQQPAYLAVRS